MATGQQLTGCLLPSKWHVDKFSDGARRFCVSQHPQVEAKIVEELGRHGLLATADAPQPRPLQYEDLSRLTYLNLVIKVWSGSLTCHAWRHTCHPVYGDVKLSPEGYLKFPLSLYHVSEIRWCSVSW